MIIDSENSFNNSRLFQTTTNKSFQKCVINTQSSFETKVLAMITNLQKGFEELTNEIFAIKNELYKYNAHIDNLESIVLNNSQTHLSHNNTEDYKNYKKDHDMKDTDEDHDSNATETPNQNNKLSKQYFTTLKASRSDINNNTFEDSTSQKMIFDQLSQLSAQFHNLQNKNAKLKQAVFKDTTYSPFQSLTPLPTNN